MNLLAIDTATEACSVAVSVGGEVWVRHVVAGRSHTQILMPTVHELLREAGIGFSHLDGLVCGIGPGSFAGVRIGVGVVKGLSMATGLPVVGVSSLEAMALPALDRGAAGVLCAIDARMGEVYWGAYAADPDSGLPNALIEPCVTPPAVVPAPGVGRWSAVGTGWGSYAETLAGASGVQVVDCDPLALPRADDALRIGRAALSAGRGSTADALVPVYLRNKVALTLSEQQAARRLR